MTAYKISTRNNPKEEYYMKRLLSLLIAVAFVASASLALAKDYQVTGPVVDIKDDQIVVKKGNENWELARDKDTKGAAEIKKGDRVTIKYKMIATSVESKSTAKAEKTKGDAKAGAMKEEKKEEKKADAKAGAMKDEKKADAKTK